MKIGRAFGFVVASFVLAAPIFATAQESVAQADSEPAALSQEGEPRTGGGSGGECRPILQSCSVNSQCCANLCVLGLCL